MCGIAGIVTHGGGRPVTPDELRRMLAMLRHRGPDEFGLFVDGRAGIGNARLSIIDLAGGQQPIANEDGTLWIVFNGEIFNYLELRPDLEARGHRFSTDSDTEVILHLYEEYGPACLKRLNGQFAIAIWDTREQRLFLARDRLGVRPVFYTQVDGRLVFGSEIKALRTLPEVRAEMDPAALEQVFTFWTALSPRTVFRDIQELPPGHWLIAQLGQVKVQRYWELDFDPAPAGRPLAEHVEEFYTLLLDAVRLRLRADVPVGAYLSGGLDSSLIASLIRSCTATPLETFSIAFSDRDYDESAFQREMAAHLGTTHHVVQATHADIGRVFPVVTWHAETPLTRTSPAPMFLLSKLVQDRGFKVVLTGEGADEFLAGYDIFKEARIRRFWAREPGSMRRPLLLRRLYRDIPGFGQANPAFLTAFFKERLTEVDAPWYSHFIRWRNNRRACRFFSADVRRAGAEERDRYLEQIEVPAGFRSWGPLERAQYLEVAIFLSGYLLSSQGDRMGMAHSVEGRFPFLDHRVIQHCTRLPSELKLRGLTEKFLLRECGRRWLPQKIWERPKRPYRAPIHRSFCQDGKFPDYVREACSPERLREAGFFDPGAVGQLLGRIAQGAAVGETDDMALAGIISTQLLHRSFIRDFPAAPPLGPHDNVKVRGELPS